MIKAAAIFFCAFAALSVFASSSVLISGFEPFDGARANYSQMMGKELAQKLSAIRPDVEFKYCQLRTVYDKAADELLDCVRSMRTPPKFALSLGEAGCREIKLETSGINLDRDFTFDNDGVHRDGTPILPGGPFRAGVSLPYHKAWCGLSPGEKKFAKVSNDPGSFVCNNTAYRMAAEYPEIRFGFMHVPSHNCFFLNRRRNYKKALAIIEKMVLSLMNENLEDFASYPVSKEGVLRRMETVNACERTFYSQLLEKY